MKAQLFLMNNSWLQIIIDDHKGSHKKDYLDGEIVPITSDTPTIETINEYLDSEYW